MNFLIPLILLIYISLSFSASNDPKNDKEYARAERKVKSLACSILSNTNIPFFKNTRRQIKELLKKNEIIQKTADMKVKMPEFLAAICYQKIETDDAQEIVENLSKRKMEILEKKEYIDLFDIDPNLNFTKIKRVMNRVNKIMKKIENEEMKQEEDNKTFELDEDNINLNETNYFSMNSIMFKFKKFFKSIGLKKLYIIGINIVFILITIIAIFCFNNNSNKNETKKNEKGNKNEEKKENNQNNEEKKKDNIKEKNNKEEEKNTENNLNKAKNSENNKQKKIKKD